MWVISEEEFEVKMHQIIKNTKKLQDNETDIQYELGSNSKPSGWTAVLVTQQHFWQLALKDEISTDVTEMGKGSLVLGSIGGLY